MKYIVNIIFLKIFIIAALHHLYRSGRVETLKQFCGVVPGDRTTQSFLDPLEVIYDKVRKTNTCNLSMSAKKINFIFQLARYRRHHFPSVDEEFNNESYVDSWADADLLDESIRNRLANIQRRFFSYDPQIICTTNIFKVKMIQINEIPRSQQRQFVSFYILGI